MENIFNVVLAYIIKNYGTCLADSSANYEYFRIGDIRNYRKTFSEYLAELFGNFNRKLVSCLDRIKYNFGIHVGRPSDR